MIGPRKFLSPVMLISSVILVSELPIPFNEVVLSVLAIPLSDVLLAGGKLASPSTTNSSSGSLLSLRRNKLAFPLAVQFSLLFITTGQERG